MRWSCSTTPSGCASSYSTTTNGFQAGKARLARVAALERELRRRDLDVMMSIKCRADDVEEGLFRRLLDMGVVRAYVGIESGSDHSLRDAEQAHDGSAESATRWKCSTASACWPTSA